MKKIRIFFLISLVLCFFSSVKAQTNPLGVGIRISNSAPVINTSLSVRYYLNSNHAIEGLLSFKPVALGGLYEVFKPISGPAGLTWFYGAGAYIGFAKPVPAGAQGVVGLDYNIPTVPINLSVDWKPELSIGPKVNFEPDAVGLSVRFILNKSTK